MPIDTHAQWRPAALADAFRKRTIPPLVERNSQDVEVLRDARRSVPVADAFDDMGARLRSMDCFGIETAVSSLFGQLQWIERLPVAESLPLCRIHNDAMSELCERHPGRFAGYASLPLADLGAAAGEFHRALALPGIIGAILPGNAFLTYEAAKQYAPLMDVADRHGAIVFVHWGPRPGDPWPRIPFDSENANPRLGTSDMQSSLSYDMVTLCFTDFLDGYPNARVHVHNLGGNLPFEIERMDQRCHMDTPDLPLPSTRVRKPNLYLDCNSFGSRAIELGVEIYGEDRILFATDSTEFSTEWTIKAIEEARIGTAAKQAIRRDNAARLLSPLTAIAEPARAAMA